MDEDDLLSIPADILDELRVQGFRFVAAGLYSILFDEAQEAALRAAEAARTGKRRQEWGATAATILCASAACEARLSEYLAHSEAVSGSLAPDLAAIRGKTDALEQWRQLLRARAPEYDLARSREYQHLGCLIRLRDLVAHRSARLRKVGSVPEHIADCARQGVVPLSLDGGAEWPSMVLVVAVAGWAVATAARWLNIADELLPFSC